MNKKIKIGILLTVVMSLIILVFSFLSTNEYRVKSTLSDNGINEIKTALSYDKDTKTLMYDGDISDKQGRSPLDLKNLAKAIPELYHQGLVKQFEFKQINSVDFSGAFNRGFKVVPNKNFHFKEDVFISQKWNKDDKGYCQRYLKVIPTFAHTSTKSARKIEKDYNVKLCSKWKKPNNYKSLWG